MNFEELQLDSPDIPEACRDAYRAQIGAWPAPGERDPMAAVWAMAWLSKPEAAADDDGWLEWSGGECPVSPGTPVHVKLRSGLNTNMNPNGPSFPIAARDFWWDHYGRDSDIVAYRIVKEARHG